MSGTFESTATRFCLRKPRAAVERYADLLSRLTPRNVMEIGIFEGGSTSFISQLARPDMIVGVDILQPRKGIEAFIAARGLESTISLHWEVDQSDTSQLSEIVRSGFGGSPIDLIIDDASHALEGTRSAFNLLFPHLRPGGEYVIEDWAWAHQGLKIWPNRPPLTVLVVEAVMACAHRPDLIADVEIDRFWTVIRRGEGSAEQGAFDIRELCGERGARMAEGLERDGTGPPTKPRRRMPRLR